MQYQVLAISNWPIRLYSFSFYLARQGSIIATSLVTTNASILELPTTDPDLEVEKEGMKYEFASRNVSSTVDLLYLLTIVDLESSDLCTPSFSDCDPESTDCVGLIDIKAYQCNCKKGFVPIDGVSNICRCMYSKYCKWRNLCTLAQQQKENLQYFL